MALFRNAALVAITVCLLLAALATSVSGAAPLSADLAHQKFARIEAGKLAAGVRIDLSAAELNAWAVDEARIYAPGATRNIKLELTPGRATGSLMIDFLKLRQAATHEDPGWIMKNLFAGERPVRVTARLESNNRRARVDVERVEVSGVKIEGAALDFLIENWLRPTFPDVKVNEWFELGFRIDRFTVLPRGVSVFIGK